MDSYKELRARGFHSLAAVYKIKRKFWFNSNCDTNIAETYALMHGPIFSCSDIDRTIERLHDAEQVTHELDVQILTILDSSSKTSLKNPASWRFASNWIFNRNMATLNPDPETRQRSRNWFNHIAEMNPCSEVGKRAAKIVKLIDRRNDVQ